MSIVSKGNDRNERNARYNPNKGKGEKKRVEFKPTIESSTTLRIRFDTTFFTFREMDELAKQLKLIGIDGLVASNKYQNEVAWVEVADLTKRSKIEEIYHAIAVGVTPGEDLKVGDGVTCLTPNIVGDILTFNLEGHPESVHFGAIGLSDTSLDFGGRFNSRISIQDNYFHLYNGAYISENEWIEHDLAMEYPNEQPTKNNNRHAVTTAFLKGPKAEFKIRPNEKAIVFTYRFLDLIEKLPGEFMPIYEVQVYYFNKNFNGAIHVTSAAPIRRVANLVNIVADYQNQGFGYVTSAAFEDLKLISEFDFNKILAARGVETKFILNLKNELNFNRKPFAQKPRFNNAETTGDETNGNQGGKKQKPNGGKGGKGPRKNDKKAVPAENEATQADIEKYSADGAESTETHTIADAMIPAQEIEAPVTESADSAPAAPADEIAPQDEQTAAPEGDDPVAVEEGK